LSYDSEEIEWRSRCPISCALDIIGDRWSLLIIRDLLRLGPRTYSQFRASPEQISTNILASRLKLLAGAGIIERVNPEGPSRNNAYQLTASGQDLRPVVEGVGRWSTAHLKQHNPAMFDLSKPL